MQEQIETDRLVLKMAGEEYAGRLLDFLIKNREVYGKYEPEKPQSFFTEEYQRMVLKLEYEAARTGNFLRYYFFERGKAEIIGTASVSNIMHYPYSQGCIGYKMALEKQNLGYATEGVAAVCLEAVQYLGIRRLEANVMEENKASIRVLEKCGFTLEGKRKQNLCVAGKWQDHLLYAKIFS